MINTDLLSTGSIFALGTGKPSLAVYPVCSSSLVDHDIPEKKPCPYSLLDLVFCFHKVSDTIFTHSNPGGFDIPRMGQSAG